MKGTEPSGQHVRQQGEPLQARTDEDVRASGTVRNYALNLLSSQM